MNQIKDWKKYTREQKIGTFIDARSWYGKVFEKLVLKTKLSPAELYSGDEVETFTNRDVKNWSKIDKKQSKARAIAELKDYLIRAEQQVIKKKCLKEMNILDAKIAKLWSKFWNLDINKPQK